MLHPALKAVSKYLSLFNEKNWSGVLKCLDAPLLVLIANRKLVLTDEEAIFSVYRALQAKFDREGAVRLTWAEPSCTVVELADGLALVKTVLSRETGDGTITRTWNCSYLTRVVENEWRIAVLTSDDTSGA